MIPSQRLGAAAVVASMALGACSQSHQRVSAPLSSTTTSSRVGGTATSAPANGGLTLASVRKTTAAVHSYSYHALTTTTGKSGSSTTSTFAGKVVSPDRVSYTATVGRRTFEIVRIGATSYRRDPGKAWTKLATRKNLPPPPAATLLAVLDHLGPVAVSPDGKVSTTLSPRDASEAGLASGPGIAGPVEVAMTVDASGHVLHLDATVRVSDAHTKSTLRTQTDFTAFDAPGDITAPV